MTATTQEETMAVQALAVEPGEDEGREATTAPAGDSLARYFREVGCHPLLTRAEEIRLARLARAGDRAARRRLVESNLRLVVAIARGYRGLGLDFLDLIQEGNLGLVRAVERYDPDRDMRFGTYASWCIRGSICRALSTKSRVIRLPVRLAQHEARISRVEQQIAEGRGRQPSSEEVARAVGLDEGVVRDLRVAGRSVASLSEPAGDGNTMDYGDVVAADPELDPAVQHSELDERRSVGAAVGALDDRSRRVIELRYGLDGNQPCTLAEAALELGLSRERVRKIEARALLRLRERPELNQLRSAA